MLPDLSELKIKKYIGCFIVSLLFLMAAVFPTTAKAADNTWSEDPNADIYTISTVSDLNAFRAGMSLKSPIKYNCFANKKIVLANDITIQDGDLTQGVTYKQSQFKGIFDGQGHTINNFNDTVGPVFGALQTNSAIYNLNVTVNNIYNDSANQRDSVFAKSPSGSGIITSDRCAGTIENCAVTGDIQFNHTNGNNVYFGGIAGFLIPGGKIKNCYSRLNVVSKINSNSDTSVNSVAGICVSNNNGTISDCYSTSTISLDGAKLKWVYPIVKNNMGTATDCYYLKDIEKDFPANNPTTNNIGTALSSDEMKAKASYANWDFDREWAIDAKKNDGYPTLQYNLPLDDPKIIAVEANISVSNKTVPEDTTVLTADFLKADYTITPIVRKGNLTDEAYNAQVAELAKLNASYKLRDGQTDGDPQFRGIATNAEDFSGKGAKFLLNQQLVYDEDQLVKDGYTITFFDSYTTSRTPVVGTDFEINSPSLTFNSKTGKTVSDEQITKEKTALKQAQTASLDYWYKNGTADILAGDVDDSTKVGDSWAVFTMARAGYVPAAYKTKDEFYKACYAQYVKKYAKTNKDESGDFTGLDMREVSKDVLAITAMGYDARNVGGVNLINALTNGKNTASSGIVSPTIAYAIDSYNYVPTHNDSYIHNLANTLNTTGANMSSDALIDMSLMEWQPIFAYYNPNAKEGDAYYDVKQAVENVGLPFIKNHLAYNGLCYNGFDCNNPWSMAQIYIAMGIGKVNIYSPEYISDGYSLISSLSPASSNFGEDESQIARGYEAELRGMDANAKSLFDCTDVSSTVPVNDKINALTNDSTKEDVQAARKAYDALTDSQKDSIQADTYKKLTDQEARLAAADVSAAIAALPEAAKVQLSDASAISAARSAYDALTADQQKQVTNLDKLTADEAALNALKDAQSAAEAVAAVQKQIAALPDADKVKAGDADAIAAARKAYDALPAAEQAQVTNLKHLTDAEAALKDIQAADAVTKAIDALPAAGEIKKSDADAIAAARKAYDALTDGQKKQVTNLDKLTAAEAALKALDTATLDYQAGSGTLDSNWQSGGSTSGTTGRGLKVTALRAKVVDGNGNAIDGLGVSYSVHLQNLGWRAANADGQTAGSGDLRVEALKMTLTGAKADQYDVYYRVHVQDIGWMNWAKNGDMAGTAGFAYQIEALQAVLVPKGGSAPAASPANNTEKSGITAENVRVDGHSQNIGWTQGWQQGNQMATATVGTTGQALRLEAFKLESADSGLQLHYQAHVQDIGWQKAVDAGATAGTTGQGLRLEALKIWATGDSAAKVSVQYRVHVQNTGWTDWVTAGSTMENAPAAGTTGQGLRIEALQVRTVEK